MRVLAIYNSQQILDPSLSAKTTVHDLYTRCNNLGIKLDGVDIISEDVYTKTFFEMINVQPNPIAILPSRICNSLKLSKMNGSIDLSEKIDEAVSREYQPPSAVDIALGKTKVTLDDYFNNYYLKAIEHLISDHSFIVVLINGPKPWIKPSMIQDMNCRCEITNTTARSYFLGNMLPIQDMVNIINMEGDK